MRTSRFARLASIGTKVALPCAFASLLTFCTIATAAADRTPQAPVAQAVFVTPAGDRAATQRAVVAAGGVPERWVGGRLKAALGLEALTTLRRSPEVEAAKLAETSSADGFVSQGVALSGADA